MLLSTVCVISTDTLCHLNRGFFLTCFFRVLFSRIKEASGPSITSLLLQNHHHPSCFSSTSLQNRKLSQTWEHLRFFRLDRRASATHTSQCVALMDSCLNYGWVNVCVLFVKLCESRISLWQISSFTLKSIFFLYRVQKWKVAWESLLLEVGQDLSWLFTVLLINDTTYKYTNHFSSVCSLVVLI